MTNEAAALTPEELAGMQELADQFHIAAARTEAGGNPWDGLHPDLVPYFDDGVGTRTGLPMLRHPLVYQIVPLAEHANAYYAHKQQMVAEAEAERNWYLYLHMYEKPWRLTMLYRLMKDRRIDRTDMRELLPEVWRAVEIPHLHPAREIRAIFNCAGFLMDVEAQRRTNFGGEPLDPERLYRGATAAGRRGFSWTRDRERAEWFAERWQGARDGAGYVYETIAPPEAVLAYFDDRAEAEVVVDPAMLGEITRMKRVGARARRVE